MPGHKTIAVSIVPGHGAFVRDRPNSGRFGRASEVVRAALRLLERDEPAASKTTPPT